MLYNVFVFNQLSKGAVMKNLVQFVVFVVLCAGLVCAALAYFDVLVA